MKETAPEAKVSDNLEKAETLRLRARNFRNKRWNNSAALLEIAIAIRETSEPTVTDLSVMHTPIDLDDLIGRMVTVKVKKERKYTDKEVKSVISRLRTGTLPSITAGGHNLVANMLEERL